MEQELRLQGDRKVARQNLPTEDGFQRDTQGRCAGRGFTDLALVFRDGSRQEVSSYTIVGDALYTDANRWVSGSWCKKVALASLDVPSTLRVNQERGVPFSLPSSPNEVMVRP